MCLHAKVRRVSSETDVIERWRSLLISYNETAVRLDRELSDSYGVSMSDFEALDRLMGTGADQCRMQQLAADMYLSQSALSRTVARLERAGLVERALCEADRRGVFVKVTPAGRRLHSKARQTWLAILAEQLGRPHENAAKR